MAFAGDQDPEWRFAGGNTLERNHVYRDMRVTQDGGQLYMSFAHSGDPSSEGTGAWEPYNDVDRATMVLGRRCFIEHAPLEAERAFWEGRLAIC